MRVREPGKIQDRLWYLGHEESGVYLLEGSNESMIISGGMSYILPTVIRQLKEFNINEARIRKLLILHVHFDHVGIVPYFKGTYPGLKIYASKRGWEILRKPNVINSINELNRVNTECMGMTEACSEYDWEWGDELAGKAVSEGDCISLGDENIEIFETPGHSSCSITAYDRDLKALFPSDGGGIPYKETIITMGSSNYTQFQDSLEKIKDLDVKFLCADHHGYITGPEAGSYIGRSIELAKEFRAKMEETYRRLGDVEMASKRLCDSFYGEDPDYFMPREVFEGVYLQMVRHIADPPR